MLTPSDPQQLSSYRIAKTHPPEFLIHKYWGRKPINVVESILKQYLTSESVFWDPFSGSGVAAVAASRSGATVYATDINPIACLLTRVACSQHDPDAVATAGERLIQELRNSFQRPYETSIGTIRYFVHGCVSHCATCGFTGPPSSLEAPKKCPVCGAKLTFRSAGDEVQTVLLAAEIENVGTVRPNSPYWPEVVAALNALEAQATIPLSTIGAHPLVENRRTLTPAKATIRRFFQPFALYALSHFATQVDVLEPAIRDPLLLVLTGASAQVSRLIPYRNNMKSGGPAWSIPGFWIAPVHLECNVFKRLQTRLRKVVGALRNASAKFSTMKPVTVIELAAEKAADLPPFEADLVFLDPPYAGDVPYLEFSAIWNDLLRRPDVDFQNELVVSDRTFPAKSSQGYEDDLARSLKAILLRLKQNGTIVLTFNNLSGRTWSALLQPLQAASFKIQSAHYQEPAVKSSKSQFAPNTSYVGDFYVVFKRTAALSEAFCSDESGNLEQTITDLFALRGNRAQPINRLKSAMIGRLLRANATSESFLLIDDIIAKVCISSDNQLQLREPREEIEMALSAYIKTLVTRAVDSLGDLPSCDSIIEKAICLDAGAAMVSPAEIFPEASSVYEKLRERRLSLL